MAEDSTDTKTAPARRAAPADEGPAERLGRIDEGALDQLIEVIPPRAGLALAGAALLFGVLVGWSVLARVDTTIPVRGFLTRTEGPIPVFSDDYGIVTQTRVAVGDAVKAGEPVAQMRGISDPDPDDHEDNSPPPDHVIQSPVNGVVEKILVDKGAEIVPFETILTIKPNPGDKNPLEAIVFVRASDTSISLRPGLTARILPRGMWEEFGAIKGRVISMSDNPRRPSAEGPSQDLMQTRFIQEWFRDGVLRELRVELTPDPKDPSGYAWTDGKGPPFRVPAGVLCEGTIVLHTQNPISFLFPFEPLKD